MGVNGLTTPSTAASTTATALDDTLAVVVKHVDRIGLESTDEDAIGSRRRTSIPSSFTFGGVDTEASSTSTEERRWRSFDCNGVPVSGAKAKSLDVLSLRIAQEKSRMAAHTQRLRPRKRTALFRSLAKVFSTSHQQEIALRQMQMVAHVAKANRSLVVLNDMRTIVLTMDDDDERGPPQHGRNGRNTDPTTRASLTTDTSIQRMLDGIADADQVLAEDSLHHVLELQTQFLQRTIEMHKDKKLSVPRAHGVSASFALQQFLSEFVCADGARRVPCVMDSPTPALVRFEKLLTRYRLLQPQVKHSLDQLCRDTMASFTRMATGYTADLGAASIWETRDRRDVLQSLMRELEDGVVETASVTEPYRTTLGSFIEQLVFSRLAGACYQSLSVELDEKNSLWREQIARARELQLQDVGLPVEIPEQHAADATPAFARSIEAFNHIPHLIPSCVMAAFLSAVRVLYEETNALIGLQCPCISADVLLPLLVFVLSRTDLPHLYSQVFLMEHYAIDESQEGSEAAYYLACLQAAMGYIVSEIDHKTPAE